MKYARRKILPRPPVDSSLTVLKIPVFLSMFLITSRWPQAIGVATQKGRLRFRNLRLDNFNSQVQALLEALAIHRTI